ncbi:energy-coupling factor ABC transporter ATP-binding protein [Bombilactobacillus bombi]|uniref:Energy-coupling factor ABC transporter ATP-binding protein n=1 Tax=Bombilactobacillus bombi TaxID=1303590 RepID=A0A3R6YTS7_9LACO|nr:energy-coupling factor ABC transporter ATP-binding protein [Bombilactobacillus bombi]RHW51885.1 energy-coupling factor ABC transporter ATP-binding protein [Bombilactobacillus bombi]
MKQIVSLKNVTFTYENANKPALDNINLDIPEREWVAIVGLNGSGKSTLAKLLNGILVADSGVIEIDGEVLSEATIWHIRKKIGIIFQNPDHQFVGATVEDDVAFGLENIGMKRSQMLKRVAWALAQVHMQKFAHKSPQTLSGGQKQRVAIAGIIALQPKIIIMDESTSMLDPNGRHDILKIIQDLQAQLGVTVLSITHDMAEIVQADSVVVLNHGKIQKKATVAALFDELDDLQQMGLQLPFTQRLQRSLQLAGIPIVSRYQTKQGLADELWQLHSNM